MHRLEQAIEKLHKEFARSVQKHGNWDDYQDTDVWAAVLGEFLEVRDAYLNGHIHGPHSMTEEMLQLANVCIKGFIVLSEDPGETA